MQQDKLLHNVAPLPSHPGNRNNQLNVAFYSPGWPPELYQNGIITYVSSMRDGLQELGHVPHVVTFSQDGAKRRPHNALQWVNHHSATLFNYVRGRIQPEMSHIFNFAQTLKPQLNDLAQSSGLDLFEIEESFGWADVLRHQVRVPIVVRLHGPWFLNGAAVGTAYDAAFTQRVRWEGTAIANALAVSAPSKNVLEQTRQYYKLPLEKAVVIPCPIPSTPKEDQWQLESCDKNLIAFIGRFDRHKGGDLVIDAFAQVVKELPALKLCFAGPDRGFTDDQGREWQLDAYVRERLPGALESGQVSWLGPQPPDVLRQLRLRASLTVIASRYDNFPYTALEALSQGCPIVGANAGGIPEIITDGTTGVLFESGNASDLADQMLRLLRQPHLAAELAAQAGQDCTRRFSPKAVAQQSVDFYREAIARWSREAR